ncbi:NF-X1-type zinc finger protein NFXL1-like [Xenia sp. Carnegie-2017]|uniref:NF-X1-type zinc finger protein NFXL1-like n=1 Tax=Xenia sp. Carnegie-2017 TaxID=2897299 RepID=UPI001F04DF9E|nr:NF-X1-type zinc finger protein NFXL1-like [Xenia sp. Carnegie-2017]
MNQRPAFLGRGRGRGTRESNVNRPHDARFTNRNGAPEAEPERGQTKNTSAWDFGSPGRKAQRKDRHVHDICASSERRKKAEEIRQSAANFSKEAQLSSSESDDDVNDTEILRNTLTAYQGDEDNLVKIKQYLQESCSSRALICLICIESIKHNNPIWSCSRCYSIFHLQCIQQWSNDGAVQNLPLSHEHFPHQELVWFCPKCRCEYKQSERPKEYVCFCGKTVNPKFDPWSVPHSCGEICGRQFTPDCGHTCLLLCHPGPCPPCPKMVRVTCHCGSQAPKIRRCSAKEWSCGKTCGKILSCGHHTCTDPCHAGLCKPCPKHSLQKCLCGRNTMMRPCAEPQWQCKEICGKLLECGNHYCSDVCHGGKCPPCPKSGKRTCPCGKTSVNAPCTEDVPLCGDTCDRLLSCGRHTCTRRCHLGPCEKCRQMVKKKCRCGKREKSVQCSQEFICDIKCTQMKNCGRHQCRRKCCDGGCPPCEQICNRQLNCKNHKCPSVCHQGQCYPCPLTTEVTCFCGSSKLSVPCGRERVTKPPKCLKLCKNPSDCHHPTRKPHRCHFGPCPPCKQICGYILEPCGHKCQMECHDRVVSTSKKPDTVKWPVKHQKHDLVEAVAIPCGPCKQIVSKTCLGGHETISVPCHQSGDISCGRPCGRLLSCGNHYCQLECHTVTDAPDEKQCGLECEKCERPCMKPRPPGCTHSCRRRCHPGDCGMCKQMVKRLCHCSSITIHLKCCDLTTSDDAKMESLLSCKGNCPKKLACGHLCPLQCHSGPCLNVKECSRKVSVRCPCKRLKRDVQCHQVQHTRLDCNEECRALQIKTEKQRKERERIRQEEESKHDKEELEKFERKKQGRKRRVRKEMEEVEEPSWITVHRNIILVVVVLGALLAFIIHIAVAE